MKKGFRNFLIFLGVILLLCTGYFGGYAVGHKNFVIEDGYKPKVLGVSSNKAKDIDFSIFWDAWYLLKDKFVGELDYKQMVYGAIQGMAKSTGDPYTTFMMPDDAKRFKEDLKGSFEGIGAELENKDGRVVVVAPLDGSPAEKAGLRAQDVILKVNGQEVANMSFYETINNIRGEKGTDVTLNIYRPSTKDNLDIIITRDTITVKSVTWEEKDGSFYIKVSQFGDDTLSLIKKAAQEAIDKNQQNIIIDLRNNPGGYLETAIDMASIFLDDGKTVVFEENKKGDKKRFKTTLSPILKNKKLVVLVNGGSASASEIFAGAIQDNKQGTIIGEKTFGKGSVQTLENLKDDSQLKITIAKWLRPNGENIDKIGINPDIVIEMTEEDINEKRDPQLDKALEVLGE